MLPTLELFEMSIADHVVAAVLCLLAPIMAYSSRRVGTEELQIESEDKVRLYHSNTLLLIVFTLVIITTWRIPGRPLTGLGFNWPQWNVVVIGLLFVIILFYLLDIFFQYGIRRWREKTIVQKKQSIAFFPANNKELLHFMFLALAAGIGEEIIFRGFLIQYLVSWAGNDWSGILAASLFSSGLFAFLHGYQGTRSIIKIFFLSLLFSALFIYSQSLLLVILIHIFIDLISGWLGIYLYKSLPTENSTEDQ